MGNDKIRILIADDEEIYTSILEYILSPHYDTAVVNSGEHALETAFDTVPDLILLDVLMPDMSGFEVLKRLKDNAVTQNIPVIFITGLNATEDEEHGFFLGAIDYITKPFVNSIMMARVRTHVQIINHIRTIEQMGLIDSLTSLPNRRGFDERFSLEWERAIREQSPISLLFMDMDKFKSYNDTYGHPFGDTMIQASGKIYQQTLKRATDFVSRWGGDEFAILLPNTDSKGACEIAEKVRLAISNSVITTNDGINLSATISIGVHSAFPTYNLSADDFMENVDKALYMAKKEGRNRYHLYDETKTELYSDEAPLERQQDAAAHATPAVKSAPSPIKSEFMATGFMKNIRRVQLLDINAALDSIGGSEELYERILKMVVHDVPANIKTVEKSLFDDNDLRAFSIKVHSIKSSLNQIGYKKLASQTELLEEAARKGDETYCREYYSVFKKNLLSFYSQVSVIINPEGSEGSEDLFENFDEIEVHEEETNDEAVNVKKILVVDDSTTNLSLIKAILNPLYKVFAVSSGETALKFLEKQKPNLILLDVEMPVMSGKELLEIIKSKQELKNIPIIFLTGLSDAESEAEAFSLGVNDYIRKPVNDTIMLHRVKMQLEFEELKNKPVH